MKPYASISAFFLALIAIAHLLRVLAGWTIVINATALPMWPSIVAFVVAGWLSIMLWRESKRGIVQDILEAAEQLRAERP